MARGPLLTKYSIDERQFRTPRASNASINVEHQWESKFAVRVSYNYRKTINSYRVTPEATPDLLLYVVDNGASLTYHALEFTARQTYKDSHWLASYVRSSSRTSDALGYSIESPASGQQAPGPQPWDSPNRIIASGFYTMPESESKKLLQRFTFGANFEYHTGFPFSEYTQEQVLSSKPNSFRLPSYASLDLSIERRLRVFKRDWAARVMAANLTNRANPISVNSIIGSPLFLTYGAGQRRAFSFRLQFLNGLKERGCPTPSNSSC